MHVFLFFVRATQLDNPLPPKKEAKGEGRRERRKEDSTLLSFPFLYFTLLSFTLLRTRTRQIKDRIKIGQGEHDINSYSYVPNRQIFLPSPFPFPVSQSSQPASQPVKGIRITVCSVVYRARERAQTKTKQSQAKQSQQADRMGYTK